MLTFTGTGSWSAHSFILWANPALEVRGVLPIGRNWASKHLAKIPLKLAKEFGRPEPFNFPTCAMLCTFAPARALWFWYGARQMSLKKLPAIVVVRSTLDEWSGTFK